MTIIVRRARWRDIPAMVQLVERHRMALAILAPRFWRRAPGAALWTRRHFRVLLVARAAKLLVAEEQGAIAGALVARRVPTPPVYAPGGKSWLIDDFCVADPALWPSAGTALLEAVRREAGAVSSAQVIVIAPVGDAAKSQWLASQGLQPVSSWWTQPG